MTWPVSITSGICHAPACSIDFQTAAKASSAGRALCCASTPRSLITIKFALPETADRSSRSEEHTSELQSQSNLVCRLLLEKKKKNTHTQLLTKATLRRLQHRSTT